MCEKEIRQIAELMDSLLEAIDVITRRTAPIKSGNDFLLSPDNMFILDGVCMKLIFIGESIKNVDKLSKGTLLPKYPSIPWREVMRLRDLLVHHYFKIDSDMVFLTVTEDLGPLADTLRQIKKDLKESLTNG